MTRVGTSSHIFAQQYGFLAFLSFPELEQVYRSRELLPLLKNRLLQPSRPDYEEYLSQLGLEPPSAEPFAILERSGGRRTTDRIELFGPPTPTSDGRLICVAFARGVRHVHGAEEAIAVLNPGTAVEVVMETDNQVNPKALKLRHGKDFLGYLPDYLASELTCPAEVIDVVVHKINAPPAPVHHRMLLQVTFPSTDPLPFSGEKYRPLSAKAAQLAA